MNYIKPNLVVEALAGHKGQFVGITVDKKLKKGEDTPIESRFNFKVCKENAPSYTKHENLHSIRLPDGRYKSFDIRRVKVLTVSKNLLQAI